MTKVDPRVHELEQLARDEGITLPWPAEVIVQMEEKGHYVDLNTGLIGSDQERVSLTVIGEAELIAAKHAKD